MCLKHILSKIKVHGRLYPYSPLLLVSFLLLHSLLVLSTHAQEMTQTPSELTNSSKLLMPSAHELSDIVTTLEQQQESSEKVQNDFSQSLLSKIQTLELRCEDLENGLKSTTDAYETLKHQALLMNSDLEKKSVKKLYKTGLIVGGVSFTVGFLLGIFLIK